MTQPVEWPILPPRGGLKADAAQLIAVRTWLGMHERCWVCGTRRALLSEDAAARPSADGVFDDRERDDVTYGGVCRCRVDAEAAKRSGSTAASILTARLRATCYIDVTYADRRRASGIAGPLGELIRRRVSVAVLQLVGPWDGLHGGMQRARRVVTCLFGPDAGATIHIGAAVDGTERQAVVTIFVPLALVARHQEPDYSIEIDSILPCQMPDLAAILAVLDPLWALRRVERIDSTEGLDRVLAGVVACPLLTVRRPADADLRWLVDQVAPLRGRGKSVLSVGWLGERLLPALRRYLQLMTVAEDDRAQRLHKHAASLEREAERIFVQGMPAGPQRDLLTGQVELVLREAAEAKACAIALDDPTPATRRAAKEATALRAEVGWSATERPASDGEVYLFAAGLAFGARTGVTRRPPQSALLRPGPACDEQGMPLGVDEGAMRWIPARRRGATPTRWIFAPTVSPPAQPTAVAQPAPIAAGPSAIDRYWPAADDRPQPMAGVPDLSVHDLAQLDPSTPRDPISLWALAQSRHHFAIVHGDVALDRMIEVGSRGIRREWFGQLPEVATLWAAEHALVQLSLSGLDAYLSAGLRSSRGGKREDTAQIRHLIVDLDPLSGDGPGDIRARLARLYAIGLPPTLVVYSGRGVQAWLTLRAAVSPPTDVERTWKRLVHHGVSGADRSVWGCYHVQRLAGGLNTKTRRAAYLVHHDPTRVYALDEIELRLDVAGVVRLPVDSYTTVPTSGSLLWEEARPDEEVLRGVGEATRQILQLGPAALPPDADRSSFDFQTALDLIEAGATREQIHRAADGPWGEIRIRTADGGPWYLEKTIDAAALGAAANARERIQRWGGR